MKLKEYLKETSNNEVKAHIAIYSDKYEARIEFQDIEVPNHHLQFSNIRNIIKEYGIPKENEDKFFMEMEGFPEKKKEEIENKLFKMAESFRSIVVKELNEFVKKTEDKVKEAAEKYGEKKIQ